jgi:ATP-dependent helicase Lhr and Lhr-like helicase
MSALPAVSPTDDLALVALGAWFARRGWSPAPFQRELWSAWRAGRSGLLHAPTGSGKTLAVWGGALLDALASNAGPTGLRVLWITPLRALAADTLTQLRAPLAELGLGFSVERRTADSSPSERRRLRERPPWALVTTPESLSLLLSYPESAERFAALDAVIVDEWHELLGSRRGVQLELCLARLKRWRPALKCWGISATLGNLGEAMAVLRPEGDGLLIEGPPAAPIIVRTVDPGPVGRLPWAGHLGLRALPGVLSELTGSGSSLVFTNTRAQAELWHEALSAVWPYPEQTLALHHGSLDRQVRHAVEDGLRQGTLRCVVATASLDLGVDFPAVDRVVQIGSPKGIARLLQRAGRSRHQPGGRPEIALVPTHALELLEIAAARRALAAGSIESRPALRGCLDVLAQHLMTLAASGGWRRDELLAEVRCTHAFATLEEPSFDRVVELLRHGGAALARYPDYQRLVLREGRHEVHDRRTAERHRWSIGTIVADGQVAVRYLNGAPLGLVEERFVARLKPGDRFRFAGRTLELVRVREMVAQVRRSAGTARETPRWMGGRMPLSSELASAMRSLLAEAAPQDLPEWPRLAPLLAQQARLSGLPLPGRLLAEMIHTRDGQHLVIHPYAGRPLHEGLAALLATRLARRFGGTWTFAINDYGLIVSRHRRFPLDPIALRELLAPGELAADIEASLNLSELARRQFREIARIAGLAPAGAPGRRRSLKHLQASSSLLFEVLREHEPAHVLLEQAEREVREQVLALPMLEAVLAHLNAEPIDWREPSTLTPLAFPLWAEKLRGQIGHEDFETRVREMAARVEAQWR